MSQFFNISYDDAALYAGDGPARKPRHVPRPKQKIVPKTEPTPRQMQVAELLAQGFTAPQIANKLHLATPTVRMYRQQMYERLGLANYEEFLNWWAKRRVN